jgi:hypothetical protein
MHQNLLTKPMIILLKSRFTSMSMLLEIINYLFSQTCRRAVHHYIKNKKGGGGHSKFYRKLTRLIKHKSD